MPFSRALAFCALLASAPLAAQSLIVNEFYRGGTLGAAGDEWIEVVLLNDMTSTELETYLVGDSQAATNSKLGAYRFANLIGISPFFRAGSIIVVTGGAGVTADTSYDPDNDDWNLVLPTNGPNIVVVNASGDLAGTDVVWVDTAATGTAITADGFCVHYDSTPGTLAQTCQVEIPVPNNNSGAVLTGLVFDAEFPANWSVSIAAAALTPGQPNGGANTTSILLLREGAGKGPELSFNNVSVLEGDSGEFPLLTFTATLDAPADGDCEFRVETFPPGQANDATPGVDYVALSDLEVVILDGETSTTFSVTVIGDDVIEGDEVLEVAAFGEPGNCNIFKASGIGTILDDDVPEVPTLSIDNVTVVEGTGPGLTEAVFTVTLNDNRATRGSITVDYATANGSATAPADYASTVGTLDFSGPGNTRNIRVPIVRDNITEDDETFFVNLSNPVGATIDTPQGLGTIEDDDDAPTPSVNNVSLPEGNAGVTPFVFTVTLSNPSAFTERFAVQTEDGSAVAPVDYAPTPFTIIDFAPGVVSQQVTVNVNGDTEVEADEQFFLRVYQGPRGAERAAARGVGPVLASGTGTILNDDVALSLSINSVSVVEGTGAGTTNAQFSVSVSGTPPQGSPVSVQYATANGSALAPADYASSNGTLTFTSAGPLTQQISVPIVRDNLVEGNETFVVNLSNPVGATIATGQGTGTILDDDSASLSINNVTQAEGNGGGFTAFVFTVSSSNPSATPMQVNFQTQDGSALAPQDYQASNGTLTIPALASSATIAIQVVADDDFEPTEDFRVLLSAPVGATIANGTGIGTILGDDSPVNVPALDRLGLLLLLLGLLGPGLLMLRVRR